MNKSNNNANAIPLAIELRMKWLVNNQRFADVVFVVGAEKQMFYAHKNIIASGSPVFEQMFFANHNLKVSGAGPIEVPDLTPTGFKNMLKYIYTMNLNEVQLSRLFETFMAGDKYQVYSMNETLFSFIKNELNASNCCIIYDQLLMFPSEYCCMALDQVKNKIRFNSVLTFNSEHFVHISQETLVDLLSIDALSIEEIDVLSSCAKWVDKEIERLDLEANATNKQMVFMPIKKWIRFSEITFDQLRNFNPIKDLLSSDELGSLLLHLLNVSTFTSFQCNTARKTLKLKSACCNIAWKNRNHYAGLSQVLKASGTILLTIVTTFLPANLHDVNFSIHNMENEQEIELNYEKLGSSYCFNDPVKLDSTKEYKFVFQFPITTLHLSTNTKMIAEDDESFYCKISSSTGVHCLKQIDFYEIC